MPRPIPLGLYERLLSKGLEAELEALAASLDVRTSRPDAVELPRLLARYVHHELLRALESKGADEHVARGVAVCQRILEELAAASPAVGEGDRLSEPASLLTAVLEKRGLAAPSLDRPSIPLGTADLLVNAPGEPSLARTLASEIPSADRIDLLCAFIKWNGFRLLEDALRAHLGRSRRLRVLTTTYVGATERRAVDRLAGLGAEVRVCYESRTTRLHAKAWLFERESGFSTAFVGSSNLSHSALMDGLEWNVRLSQSETPELLEKFRASFEGYWEDSQFESYRPGEDAARFDEALARGRGTGRSEAPSLSFELRPYPFQEEILQALRAERERHGRHRNLVVAAPGTGKTLVAAFDYRRLAQGEWPSLLFVAHREEILKQSLEAFRAVLRDQSFGELLVGGERPEVGRHVFASIQSLSARNVEALPAEGFEVLIVDEFHRAAAPTYERLLRHLKPRELLGLTATPERTDRNDAVFGWFDGRIAVELRLWEALERGLLCPFQYFGVHDGVDLSRLEWRRGGYVVNELSGLYTADDRRVELVLRALRDRVLDARRMRALGFCVSVAHAEYMAARFSEAGIPAMALSGETGRPERRDAVHRLRRREVNVLFTVDLFNEGVDLPELDTVLFLRPTESATLFLQQLGRGLRLADGKDCLTVLDFIGRQHSRFRFDRRFEALTGTGRGPLKRQVQEGFPFLPPGCSIQLDRVATRIVLENLRASVGTRFAGLVDALRAWEEEPSLAEFLEQMDLTLGELYRRRGWTWSGLRRAAGLAVPDPGPRESALARGVARLAHLDDPEWLGFLREVVQREAPPVFADCSARERRILTALHLSLRSERGGREAEPQSTLRDVRNHPALREELAELFALLEDRVHHVALPLGELLPGWEAPVPLSVHSRYSLDQILAAFGRSHRIREGVLWDEATGCDVFFVTLQKSEKHYSPTTRYRDYAISPSLFHWESQSVTSAESPTGRRYRNHAAHGSHVLLFVREHRKLDGETQPYVFLGPADYVSHVGERPMAITWRLRVRMPPQLYERARVAS